MLPQQVTYFLAMKMSKQCVSSCCILTGICVFPVEKNLELAERDLSNEWPLVVSYSATLCKLFHCGITFNFSNIKL